MPVFVDARDGVSGLIADGGAEDVGRIRGEGCERGDDSRSRRRRRSEMKGRSSPRVEASAALRQSHAENVETTNGVETPSKKESTQVKLVSAGVEETLERERELMSQILDFLRANCSDLDETKLLAEAQRDWKSCSSSSYAVNSTPGNRP